MAGMWFEQLTPGLQVRHAVTRTVTETDNVLFTTMTMNPQPLHLDAEFAAGTEFGRPLMNSLFTLGLVVGLSVPELTLGTTVANLGFSAVEFPAPVFAGDTIHVISQVTESRLSRSRAGTGIVTFEHRGLNQRAQLVCRAVRAAMMRCRPADEAELTGALRHAGAAGQTGADA
jgi:acyl dehydratase